MKTRPLENDDPRCGYSCGKCQSPTQPVPEPLASGPKTWRSRPQACFAKSLEQFFFHAERRALSLKGTRERLQASRQLGLFVQAQGAP
jgi:hypothetical protein